MENKKDIFCNGCKKLKFNRWSDCNYCDIYGLNISGTLERLEICKNCQTKEKENEKQN